MRFSLFAFALLVLLSPACSNGADDDPSRINVVATTTQIGDFVRNVASDRIDLTVLLSPNQDAHDFSPRPSQIRAIEDADLILRNGLALDGYLDNLIAGKTSREVVTVTEGVTLRHASDSGHQHEDEEDHEGDDPHVWFSVANAKQMVANITTALVAADADNAGVYRDNASRYQAELDGLDAEIRARVAQVPASCRKLVTNHDVLGYFAEAYGFEVVGTVIPSASSNAEASAADIATVVAQIRQAGVPAIFAELSANPRLIEQVGKEAGAKVVTDLFGDSLSAGGEGSTYIGVMRANTAKIVDALKSCSSAS